VFLFAQALFITYFVTFSVYPGITSFLKPASYSGADGSLARRLRSPSAAAVHLPGGAVLRGDLLVPATFLVFAAGDLLGRVAAAALPRAQPRPLLALALGRVALQPALLMCHIVPPSGAWAAPRLFAHQDGWPFALLLLLACTNGFVTAASLNAGPAAAPPRKRGEAATSLMVALVAGVTSGSVASLVLSLALQAL
jgi:solute carrier family 29 (equilibrative nucleoside transporter), member 1/2/3